MYEVEGSTKGMRVWFCKCYSKSYKVIIEQQYVKHVACLCTVRRPRVLCALLLDQLVCNMASFSVQYCITVKLRSHSRLLSQSHNG